MKTEIANILREAADKIEAVIPAFEEMHAGDPFPELPTKPALPDPPEGFHPAIMGPLKVQANGHHSSCAKDIMRWDAPRWSSEWAGADEVPYALRIGSEIAKLNGLEPDEQEMTADHPNCKGGCQYALETGVWPNRVCPNGECHRSTQKPDEPKTARREWGLRGHSFLDANVVVKGPLLKCDMTCITVREVLPGDPTPEQVEELVKAAEESKHAYGQNHPIRTRLHSALAPFRKP
jgi:hypothetical protein